MMHASDSDRRCTKPITGDRRLRRKCGCGCGQKVTHLGMAGGVALMSGCSLSARRWVRSVRDHVRAMALVKRKDPPKRALTVDRLRDLGAGPR